MASRGEIRRIKNRRRKIIARVIFNSFRHNLKNDKDKMYATICDGFVELGGIYVKFLQGVLLQSPNFQNWLKANRYKIFEHLDPDPIDVNAVLHHELGENVSQFAKIAHEPFAAGSFGQVYYGELKNGDHIVVKVLRPNIRETLRYDIKILGRFAWFFIKSVTTLDANVKSGTRYVFETTMREIDYVNEAKAADRMYQAFKGDSDIVIPKTYLELSTSQILTQEYIGGLSIAELIEQSPDKAKLAQIVYEQTGSDMEQQIATLGYKFLMSLFTNGITHGDLHPGNVRLLPNNKVAMLDFGITIEKPEDVHVIYKFLEQFDNAIKGRAQPADMFMEYVRLYETELFYALEKIDSFTNRKYCIMDKLKAHINSTYFDNTSPEEFLNKEHDALIAAQINKTVNKANRFGIVAHLKNADMLRAAQTYITLSVSLDTFHLIAPVYSSVAVSVREYDPTITHAPPNSMSVDQAFEVVSQWLERIAERDGALFKQIQGFMTPSRKL